MQSRGAAMLRPYWSLPSLFVFEQDNAGESLELLAPLLRREQSQKPPEPRHFRCALQPQRFIEDRVVFRFAPSRRSEKRRPLLGEKEHRCVSCAQLIAPRATEELLKCRRAEVHQPPAKRRLGREILGK